MNILKTEQFEGFTDYILKKYSTVELKDFVDWKYLKNTILDICGKALVVLINEKRINKKLKGKTPEERYKYFDKELCESGIIYQELIENYPSIIEDLESTLNSYFLLLDEVNNVFMKDKIRLLKNNLLKDDDEEIYKVSILGDLHGGKAVTKVVTNKSKLLYKPRSLENDKFFLEFLEYIFDLQRNEISDFYQYKFIDCKEYGWIEYIENTETSKSNINIYYQRVGYLLGIAYLLNISDLHFENVLCSGAYPVLVDLETIFHTSIYQPKFRNLATQRIEEQAGNSVFATGMLPIFKKDKKYGGDISGILGGTFNKEERIIINPNRDDIQFKKRLVRIHRKEHIPFFTENGVLNRYNPENFVLDIIEGFKFSYNVFLSNKQKILSFIKKKAQKVKVRVLARNTVEYSILIQAAKSPVYANKRYAIFNKLSEFGSDLLNDRLIKSEIKQMQTLSIPYFYVNVQSKIIKDIDNINVHNLTRTPFEFFLEKVQEYSLEDLMFQTKLISFSLESQNKLFVDSKNFEIYKYQKGTLNDLHNVIENLVDIIINNAIIDERDYSINWMSLGISEEEEILFESLSDDMYKGVSGIGIALLKYYEDNYNIKKSRKVKSVLDTIYASILRNIDDIDISNKDLSFFNGEIGKVAFLYKYEIKFGISNQTSKRYMKKILDEVMTREFNFDDIIGGLPGIISYFYNQKMFLKEVIIMGDKLLRNIENKTIMASYAHGQSGLMITLLYLYNLTNEKKYLLQFQKEWKKENKLKLNKGWKDIRQEGIKYSVSWCNGVTGQLISRLKAMEINQKSKVFNELDEKLMKKEINELLQLLINEGLEQNNFCLCHGNSGNLLVLNYYQKHFDNANGKLAKKIENHFYSISGFGLKTGWICGLGNHFYSFGIMTGISGILYALLHYKNKEKDLGILLPNI